MAIHAATRDKTQQEVQQALLELIETFEQDPPGHRKLIREALDNDRDWFYSSAVEILKTSAESLGAQYLVALLASSGLLLDAICDPLLDREQAFALGRAAVRVDPACDASLARRLADSESGQGSVLVRDPARLMEVLCDVGDAGRMMSSMLRLLRHPNPHLRSKAVKVVGRGSKSPKWVRARLAQPDPRVRANAVESLWSVDSSEARALLAFAAAGDDNNRVAANALLGLYYLGESSSLGSLVRMASNPSAPVRSSAAWAMGETGDIRFQEMLREMLSDPDTVTRKRAFASLARLKTKVHLHAPTGIWYVSARAAECDSRGVRRVSVAVAGEHIGENPAIPSLGFVLTENDSPVLNYRMTERPTPQPMSIAFLTPQSAESAAVFRDAIESCLPWKRDKDSWCILPYAETGDGTVPESPPNTSAPRLDCSDLWSSVWRATQLDGSARGPRYVFILSTAAESRLPGRGVVASAKNPRVHLQAIATSPNERLQNLCRDTGGAFFQVETDEVRELLRQLYLQLLARYELSYAPVSAGAPGVKVRVQAQGAVGETFAPYPTVGEVHTPNR